MFQPVRGTHDLLGDELRAHRRVVERARLLARVYGFEEIVTPIFEFSSVFHRLGESSDVISKETYSFVDRGGENLTLRPEGTAGVVRAIISGGLTQQVPLRLFYHGPMFRYDRPQKGRYRQFEQIGVEMLGVASTYADVEVIQYAHQLLGELGLSEVVILEINTLGDAASRAAYRQALVDYFQRFESQLSPDSRIRLHVNPLRILDSKEPCDQPFILEAPSIAGYLTPEAHAFFDEVCTGLALLNIPFRLNPRLVRGLDYYCHTAFEFTTQALGSQATVLGGGRYDTLSEQLGGPFMPGVGWAAGVDRLRLLIDPVPNQRRPMVVMPLLEEAWPLALRILKLLREAHIGSILTFTGNLSKRLKRANKELGRAALIIGPDELTQSSVLLRDLDTGQQQTVSVDHIVSYIQQHFIFKE